MPKYEITKAIEGAIEECKEYGASECKALSNYNIRVSAQWQTFEPVDNVFRAFDMIVVNIMQNNTYISIPIEETAVGVRLNLEF